MASMASRPLQTSADIPGQSSQSNVPPSILPSSKLLSSIISLPLNPVIVYATYAPASADDSSSEETIELARRLLVSTNKSAETSILDSLLPCVRVDKDLKCLYIFGIASQDRMVEYRERTNSLQFDGLIGEWYSFLLAIMSGGYDAATWL
jgi:mediator of RNA polymerase II transcription subunit 13